MGFKTFFFSQLNGLVFAYEVVFFLIVIFFVRFWLLLKEMSVIKLINYLCKNFPYIFPYIMY